MFLGACIPQPACPLWGRSCPDAPLAGYQGTRKNLASALDKVAIVLIELMTIELGVLIVVQFVAKLYGSRSRNCLHRTSPDPRRSS